MTLPYDGPALRVIGHVHTDFSSKFGIPRQSSLIDGLKGTVVLTPPYRNPQVYKGLEGFSHLWLIWDFSEAHRDTFSATVHPPRLGGNTRMGVFATRSPFRPNPIGLSCVRLESIEQDPELGPILHIQGADLMDGTPLLDIKPYLPIADCHPEALSGFAGERESYALDVVFPEELLCMVAENKREALIQVLSQDPRPAYQQDPERIYGFPFAGQDIRFRVRDGILTVCEIVPLS